MASVLQVTERGTSRPAAGTIAKRLRRVVRAVSLVVAAAAGRDVPRSVLALAVLLILLAADCYGAQTNSPPKAQLKISGYGLLGNWELKRMVKTLELGRRKPEFFGPAFIEDVALILTARMKRDGYLQPTISIHIELEEAGHLHIQADELLENPLPRPLSARKVHFRIKKGVLYHYEELKFQGLETMTEKQASSYFIETGTLLRLKRNRIYTPQKLQSGLANLTEVFERNGYEKATARAENLKRDDKTGAVRALITVEQGQRVIVRSVREEFFYEQSSEPAEVRTTYPSKAYSRLWLQDFTQSLKTNLYHRGYPDTTVETKPLNRVQEDDVIKLDLVAAVRAGPRIYLGDVTFEGEKRTRESIMEKRIHLEEGGLLDRIKVEEGRYRLVRLGIFDRVDLDYQPIDEHTRSVLYHVEEGKNLDFNLLFGYGSYELLRGGFEVEQYNIWGRAHHARLKAVQSFKASTADFTYTIPEVIADDVDVFLNASGLLREEVDFTRQEYGGGLGVHKYFRRWATDASVRYNYQILRAVDVSSAAATEGLTNSSVGAFIFDLKHDRRDNPLYPRKGHKNFGTLELASDYLGGDANYQRLELWNSWHVPAGRGRMLSLGLSHGVVLSIGSAAEEIPFNKRFFPGGENSIRGYQEGEASPRNALGEQVGAETYTLGTVEFEQAITPKWSLVLFSDSLGFARDAANYPFDTGLYSVGLGLRWRTIIGPVRVEYGHNLNPRDGDPDGTVHFSLGFPF